MNYSYLEKKHLSLGNTFFQQKEGIRKQCDPPLKDRVIIHWFYYFVDKPRQY